MNRKKAKSNGRLRATLADIAREMAKTRMTASVREAVEIAESRDAHTHPQLLARRKEQD
jgi:hypothetical protein